MAIQGIILEIRAGVGGAEAALFVQELLRMYSRFAIRQGWQSEVMHLAPSGNGLREAVFCIRGEEVFTKLAGEGGVHCLQRTSPTDKRGRVHTSTASVAVLREISSKQLPLRDSDLSIQTTRSGGSGGQNVNKTETSVRITHLPSGETVKCEDERSQLRNKERALTILRARIAAHAVTKAKGLRQDDRRAQIQGANRAERMRTYDLPEDLVLDRKRNVKLRGARRVLNGQLEALVTGCE